jgi:hypothetical protein
VEINVNYYNNAMDNNILTTKALSLVNKRAQSSAGGRSSELGFKASVNDDTRQRPESTEQQMRKPDGGDYPYDRTAAKKQTSTYLNYKHQLVRQSTLTNSSSKKGAGPSGGGVGAGTRNTQ